jgi:transposase
MIAPGAGVRVYLACGVTDMRKGIAGLAAQAQLVLRQDPASGAVFCYRGRRGDRIKLLFVTGRSAPVIRRLSARPRGWLSRSMGAVRRGASGRRFGCG